MAERVEGLRHGDEQAWEELFTTHYPRLFRYFRARVGGAEQAEDLAMSVFLQAFRSIDRFCWQGRPFAAWLFGIARHELASHYRSSQQVEMLSDACEPRMSDRRACAEFLEVEIQDILDRLPPAYREALELRYLIGLTGVEAAAIMGRSHGSFRSLLLRASRAFRAASEPGDGRSVAADATE